MKWFIIVTSVGIGGSLGSLSRYGISILFTFEHFPVATVLVNIIGSFLLGLLTGYMSERKMKEWLKLGLGTGFCGGFTTMSTLSADFYLLIQSDFYHQAIIYICLTLFGGLVMALIGVLVGSFYAKKSVNII